VLSVLLLPVCIALVVLLSESYVYSDMESTRSGGVAGGGGGGDGAGGGGVGTSAAASVAFANSKHCLQVSRCVYPLLRTALLSHVAGAVPLQGVAHPPSVASHARMAAGESSRVPSNTRAGAVSWAS
jgi:hypothetical protein